MARPAPIAGFDDDARLTEKIESSLAQPLTFGELCQQLKAGRARESRVRRILDKLLREHRINEHRGLLFRPPADRPVALGAIDAVLFEEHDRETHVVVIGYFASRPHIRRTRATDHAPTEAEIQAARARVAQMLRELAANPAAPPPRSSHKRTKRDRTDDPCR